MLNRRQFLSYSVLAGASCAMVSTWARAEHLPNHKGPVSMIEKITKTDEQWRTQLTEDEYHILRQAGTERAFSSPLNNVKEPGVFHCKGCDLALFDSAHKYDSGTGWPSFYQPIASDHVLTKLDFKLIYPRKEVLCGRCDGHLGHVFKDGPQPTGLRYCLNGLALTFKPQNA